MSTATLAPPVAHAASAPLSRIPTRTEIRLCVLRGVASKTLSKDVVTHMLATRPCIPTNLDLDTVLQGLKALECADDVLGEELDAGDVQSALRDLHLMLSEILAGVKVGEEVIVTERGRPVARIVPYEPGGAELDDLVRTGQVRRSRSHLPADFWTGPRPADPGGRLLQALLKERETTR